MRILVVDDAPLILELVTHSLEERWPDWQVLTASDGESGLRQLAEQEPDLVLLDVLLPEKDGFEVLAQIRLTSMVPVVMLTGLGSEQDQVRGLELGADDYLPKPFSARELQARVEAVLRRSGRLPQEPPS
ncbi:MAG: two-component system, OmpR family, alkaline phosphatase synthesis response regulator PhoP [Chloroflexota bacterium]|nr:two-component system, OmpR family, alkaline phosphatase synthesis response regulator PhoP [Chloroflexota bacterium]